MRYPIEDWSKISSTVCRAIQESITELNWWQENLPNMFNKISEDPPTAYSDASDNSWGAHFQDRNTGGNWSLEEKYYHINVKEKKC